MMKDTVSDMRKHIWPEVAKTDDNKIVEEAEEKANNKIIELKNKIDKEISTLLKKQTTADNMIKEVRQLMDNTINLTRKGELEAREETIREHIIQELKKVLMEESIIKAGDIVSNIAKNTNINLGIIVDELKKMRDDSIIRWKGSLTPSTVIMIGNNFPE